MKIFIAFIFSLLFLMSISAHVEPPKTKQEKANEQAKPEKTMRNGIKKVTIWKNDTIGGSISLLKQKYAKLSYNSKGNLTSVISQNKDGAAMEGLCYTYELF